jgi:hypothetical protein
MAVDLLAVPLLGGDIDVDFEDDQRGAENGVDTNIRTAQENKQFKACLQVNENVIVNENTIVNELGYGAANVNLRVVFNRPMNLPA